MRVSEALKLVGLVDDSFFTEKSARRGTAAHLATAYDDRGELDESSVDPEIAGYLMAWRRFRGEFPCEILAIEEHLEFPPLQLEGTLDRRIRTGGIHRILDIKSGQPSPADRYQVALYSLLWWSLHPDQPPPDRAVVYLTREGTYKLVECKDRHDINMAKAIVEVAHLLKEVKNGNRQ